MAFFDNLRAAIAAVVRPNGRRAITGANLQATLFTMIDGMGQGMQYLGVATPDTIPGTPDFPAYYLAGFNAGDEHGSWTPEAFGMDQEVSPGAILRWTGSEWVEVANPLGLLQGVYVYELDNAIRAKYTKPASGIPYSDMSAAVQDELDAGSRAEEGVTELRTLVPTQASEQNQLADKNFVNSSVQTATANFRGSWDTFADVPTASVDYPADYAGSKKPTVNDYMVVLDTRVDEWEQGTSYMTGEVVSDGDWGLFRALGDVYDSQIRPVDEPGLWEMLPADWAEASAKGGTWRFKYSGNWDSVGISGWLAEYQVNETPLTAAQIAALNSNITAALTSKLQGIPSKPVDTAAQTLSDAEKLQARTNIGINPVTSWNNPPLDTNVPAEKLVYDSLGKRGVIRQTQTWTRAADGGYDYAMSGLVFGLIPQANIDLFVSAGATFNETTGYFELNGLTDLSYEEMQKVMRYDLQNQAPVGNYKLRARTNLAPDVTRYHQNYYTWTALAFNQNDRSCEILNLGAEGEENLSQKRFFYINDNGTIMFMVNNNHVKSVYGVIDLENVTTINLGFFQNCESLERILLYGVKANLLSLAASLRLSLASVVFMVENSNNTSAITITLHAAAYARCVADTTEYTYQGNTYTGIVAYANAKQITIASA